MCKNSLPLSAIFSQWRGIDWQTFSQPYLDSLSSKTFSIEKYDNQTNEIKLNQGQSLVFNFFI